MKKIKYILLSYMILCMALTGCGKNDPSDLPPVPAKEILTKDTEPQSENANTEDASQSSEKAGDAHRDMLPDSSPTEFDMLPGNFPTEFVFSSGAGAWRTFINMEETGQFQGTYWDSDMGDNGEAYPQGTVYICQFKGQFKNIKKINDYTWSMTLSEMETSHIKGEEWIEDDTRFIGETPYGLEGGTEFLYYTPETPVSVLSEDFLSWLPYTESKASGTLSCYGIYNKATGEGFFTSLTQNINSASSDNRTGFTQEIIRKLESFEPPAINEDTSVFRDFSETMQGDFTGIWYDPDMKEAIWITNECAYVYIPYLNCYGDTPYEWELINRSEKGLCPELAIYFGGRSSGPLAYYVAGITEDCFWCMAQGQIFYKIRE